MVNHLMHLARAANVRLLAEFVQNDRNRMMYITYKFGGFKEREKHGDLVIFEHDLQHIPPFPPYVQIRLD